MTARSVEVLAREGFKKITEWEYRNDRIKPASLDFCVEIPCLYAFVVNDSTVKYIGLTETVLISRIDHYSYGNQITNKRVRQSVTFELRKGNCVSIYALHVRSARLAAEERRLIGLLSPDWNRQ